MKVTAISDLHGFCPKLPGGDLLIVAGDLTAADTFEQVADFISWLYDQKYEKKVVIAGNHDGSFKAITPNPLVFSTFNTKNGVQSSFTDYLCDSGTEFGGLKIWGTPWTPPFCNWPFMLPEEELAKKFALIPQDTDILVCHGPPFDLLDTCTNSKRAGSYALRHRIEEMDDGKRRTLICGHIHEGYGVMKLSNQEYDKCTWEIRNCSIMNEHYEPVNSPQEFEL